MMGLSLNPIKTETVSDQVVSQLLDLVQSGELRVGDRLPGERALCEELHVSRVPIREAFSKLEALGIIEVRRGVGAIVTRNLSGALAGEIWMRWLSDHQSEIVQVYEVREAIECQATRLAAQHATDEDIEELESLVGEMEASAAANDPAREAELDRAFHEHIAAICGNDLLLQFLQAVNEISSSYRLAMFRLPARATSSVEEHRSIIAGIASHDRSLAHEAAQQHLNNIMQLVRHVQLDPGSDADARRAAQADQQPASLAEVDTSS